METKSRVKRKIIIAFFELLNHYNLPDITATALINHAHIARSSFYKYYESVQDVLDSYIEQISKEFTEMNPIHGIDFSNYEYLLYVFQFYLKHKDYIMCIHRAGLSPMILQEITKYNIEAGRKMPEHSIEPYELYYFSGALYNVIIQWLEEGCKESPEKMAKEILSIVTM